MQRGNALKIIQKGYISRMILKYSFFVFFVSSGYAGDVTSLQFAGNTSKEMKLLGKTNLTLNAEFTLSDMNTNVSFIGTFNTGKTVFGNTNLTAGEAYLVLHPGSLALEYGTYKLNLTLQAANGNSRYLELLLIYHKPVIGLKVIPESYYITVGKPIRIDVSIADGTLIDLEYIINTHVTAKRFLGDFSSDSLTKTFTTALANKVTVTVSNAVSSITEKLTIYSVFEVSGFSILNDEGIVETLKPINFYVFLNPNMTKEMGNIRLHINYGNGKSEVKVLTKQIEAMKTYGYNFTYAYNTQGNFTVKTAVKSDVSSMNLHDGSTYVWDKIITQLAPISKYVRVNADVKFEFKNPPRSGFLYFITFGEGNNLTGPEAFVYQTFSDPGLKYKYSEPDVYKVCMTATNYLYYAYNCFDVVIQYPIPEADMILIPLEDEIPIPGSDITFTMNMSQPNPSPTNVSCDFDLGETESIQKKIETDLSYGTSVIKFYIYLRSGVKNVNFTCWNFVSSFTKKSEIRVMSFALSDFVFHYQKKVNMNMSREPDPANPGSDKLVVVTHPRNVFFRISLFNCSKLPPNITFKWNMGDGTVNDPIPLDSFYYNHTFTKRGTFTVSVEIKSHTATYTANNVIQLGVVLLTADANVGVIGITKFTYTARGILGSADYFLSVDHKDETKTVKNADTISKSYVYNEIGEFYPFVIGTNDTFYEKVYTEEAIFVDYSIQEISSSFSNTTIPLPFGNITVNIVLPRTSRVDTLLDCTFQFGDAIDRDPKIFRTNVSVAEPIKYDYHYLTLGLRRATLNCSNLIEKFHNDSMIDVVNPCFVPRGMYDRRYASAKTPLPASSAVDYDLSSRMPVVCHSPMPNFYYDIYRVEGEKMIPFGYKPPGNPSGIARFKRGMIPPGTYKVALTVELESTWCYEFTFLKFERPPPQAMIVGGSNRNLPYQSVPIDGLSESYNLEGGLGDNSKLNFTWYCYRYKNGTDFGNATDIAGLYALRGGIKYFTNKTQVRLSGLDEECGDLFTDELDGRKEPAGRMWLHGKQDNYAYFIFVLEIGLEFTQKSYASQTVTLITGQPPMVFIECQINCRDKVALSGRLSLASRCELCFENEEKSYQWRLLEYDNHTDTYSAVSDFADMAITDTTMDILVMFCDKMIHGKQYKIVLELIIPGRKPGIAELVFIANYPPYGGSCSATPDKGNATSTVFKISCFNWRDEGVRPQRNDAEDLKEPLMYEYSLKIPRMINNMEIIDKTTLFTAGESSASELLLPLGDEHFNFKVTLVVKVMDRYGDYVYAEDSVQSLPDESVLPKSDDLDGLEYMMTNYNETYLQLKASGNIIAVIRFVGATASIFSGMNVSDTSDAWKEELTNKTHGFLSIFRDAVANDSGNEPFNSGDSVNVVQNVIVSIRNKDIVNENATMLASETVEFLTRNMEQLSKMKPYPMEDSVNLDSTVQGSLSIVDESLDNAVPDELEDMNVELTLELVEQDLIDEERIPAYNGSSNDTDEAKNLWRKHIIQQEFDRRMKIRNIMEKKMEVGEISVTKMVDAVKHMQTIQGSVVINGENETVLERPNVRVTVEKKPWNNFANRSEIDKKDMKIMFADNSTNSSDPFEIKTAVFKKPPYFYAEGASKLTSKGVMVSVMNGTDEVNTSMTVKIMNEGVGSFKLYKPKYRQDDPEKKLYFQFVVRDLNDAIFVYIKPYNYDPLDYASIGLYDVSAAAATEVADDLDVRYTYELQRRDWEPDSGAYKIFIPQGRIPKGRSFIILKPLTPPPIEAPQSYRRRRRSVDDVTETPTTAQPLIFQPADANFSLIIMTAGCRTYHVPTKTWSPNGCEVLKFSTMNETACRCPDPKGSMFATTFYVPPNTINFDLVWNKFDARNAAIYGTLIGLIVCYFLACIWLRRLDRRDAEKWRINFLCDTDNEDCYFYLITVRTGLKMGAGTTSNVHFVLGAEEKDSGVRILNDGISRGFATGSVRKFIMGTQECLGNLIMMKIWHDNCGTGRHKSWFLSEILVEDIQTGEKFLFVCDRWMSEHHDDGNIERNLTVTTEADMSKLNNLLSYHAKTNLTENHLYLSIFMRPERSCFTRVQRLGCVLSLLILSMITNAMFYKSAPDGVQPNTVTIGALRFTLKAFYVSLMGILIASPPIALMTWIFQNCRPSSTSKKNLNDLKSRLSVENSNIKDALKLQNGGKDPRILASWEFSSMDHLLLPHWTVHIAWFTVFITIVTSSFFLILYSMQWGKTKSEEFMTAFALSFVESISLVDPFKILAISVLLAIVCRKPVQSESKGINLEEVREASKFFHAGSSRLYQTFRKDVLSSDGQTDIEKALATKIRREQEKKAWEALKEIIMYGIFAFIMFSISFINRDNRSFYLKNNINNALYASSKSQLGFQSVNSYEGYMKWLRTTFFPSFFPEKDYNGASLDIRDKLFFGDLDNAKIGPARLRQVKMKKGDCPYSRLTKTRACVPHYDVMQEDDADYCVGWNPYNSKCAESNRFLMTGNAWKYVKSSDIWGVTIYGAYSHYGGGGYILKLDTSLQNSIAILDELEQRRWINRETRAILIEFTLYNANTNLFAYAVFLTEFTELGGFTTFHEISVFRAYQHTGATGAFAILCYFIFVIVLIIGTVQIIRKIKMSKLRYFYLPWQVIDLFCAVISYMAILMWAMRLHYAQESLKIYYNDKKAFVNFQHIVIWDYCFNTVIGVLVFIATIRILKILGYNKRMTQLATVVTNASKELVGFAVVFFIVFFAYICLGHLLFGSQLTNYRSFFQTTASLTNSLIGKNSLDSMIKASPLMAQFYYFTYVLFVIFTLMTMFCAILNQSITAVREDINNENVFGITDILSTSVKDVMTFFATSSNDKDVGAKMSRGRKKSVWQNPFVKNEEFDTPNVLKVLRETFGSKWKDSTDENGSESGLSKDVTMMDIILSPPSPYREPSVMMSEYEASSYNSTPHSSPQHEEPVLDKYMSYM